MPDFPATEFQTRTQKVQILMAKTRIGALLLTTEAEIRYFTGFRTPFWQSPTRPWFLIVPVLGAPIAIIPAIGAELMQSTWINDIRTWPSPRPDDEGVSLLIDALSGIGNIATLMGPETSLRMPLADFSTVQKALNITFSDATPLIRAVRRVKSPAEIEIIGNICTIASAAFARAQDLFSENQPLSEAFRAFKIALLQAGADDVPYLVGAAGPGGYSDVISPPAQLPLKSGDILMLDTGATLNGYFCDFDRNFSIGRASEASKTAHRQLWAATQAGFAAASVGNTCADLYAAMQDELPQVGSSVGRFGHGLGMQLTEWPSISDHDKTALEPGMVLTLEPSMQIAPGQMMVHEENIVITDGAPIMLTKRAPPDLPEI